MGVRGSSGRICCAATLAGDTERMMQEAEQRELRYVCKFKKTAKVNRHIEKLWGRQDWVAAVDGR
jgi:hypothetical protein